MPVAPSPLRLDAELTRSAAQAASRMSRSVSEQIAHWARIGRELERASDVSVAAIRTVLDGAASYDTLPAKEQALVRAAWAERMSELRDGLRLDLTLADAGIAFAESGPDGRVVVREPATGRRGAPAAASRPPPRGTRGRLARGAAKSKPAGRTRDLAR